MPSLLNQDHVTKMCLDGRSIQKLGDANDLTTEVALETKTTLTPKESAIKGVHPQVIYNCNQRTKTQF